MIGARGFEAIMVVVSETDDSRFGLLLRCRFTPRLIGAATIGARGSEATIVVVSETDDSRFGLIGSEAIMV